MPSYFKRLSLSKGEREGKKAKRSVPLPSLQVGFPRKSRHAIATGGLNAA